MRTARHRSAGASEIAGLDAVAALRHGRRVARLSQRDLARRAGVSQSFVARIEARRVDPPVGVMQRLLGFCGLRWELRLAIVGDTTAATVRRAAAVRESANRRWEGASTRTSAENAAARGTAVRLESTLLTTRKKRECVREARLAERVTQAQVYAAIVRLEDEWADRWTLSDAANSARKFHRYLEYCRIPLAERLVDRIGPHGAEDLNRLLEALAASWAYPPAALSGWIARAVWSPGRPRCSRAAVELAALGRKGDARSFLIALGAHAGGNHGNFDLGHVVIRLRATSPLSTSLVRWRPGRPARAIVVARPETSPGPPADRHSIRAVLESAGRDARGRRRAPYHEAWDAAAVPWWLGEACARAGDAK